jgi:hypothetical protein
MAKTKLALNKFQAKLEIMTDRTKIDSSFLTTFSEIKTPRNQFNITFQNGCRRIDPENSNLSWQCDHL